MCHSDEDSPAESVMHRALFIKHSELSAGSNKTLDLLGMSILMKWGLSMRDIICGYTLIAVSSSIYYRRGLREKVCYKYTMLDFYFYFCLILYKLRAHICLPFIAEVPHSNLYLS